MPDKWDSRWDNWCHLRANNPSRSEWWWLVAALVTVLGIAVAVAAAGIGG